MDGAGDVEALSNVLDAISAKPYDLALHAQHVHLAIASEDLEQAQAAREMLTGFYAAGDEVWLPLLEAKENAEDAGTLEGVEAISALYHRAEEDYLSIPLLKKHVEFLTERVAHFMQEGADDETREQLLMTTWTTLIDLATKSGLHLTRGQEVWNLVKDWQLEILEAAPADKKVLLLPQVEAFFVDHLKEPHAGNDETFQAYSSFTTSFKPTDEYEPILVNASKMRSAAVKAYGRREASESSLAAAGYSLAGYAAYIAAERKGRNQDVQVLRGVYERAVAEAAKRRFTGEPGAEAALRQFWTGYVDTLRRHDVDATAQLNVFQRALRSVPGSGEIWSRYLRFLEHTSANTEDDTPALESIPDAYEKALSTNLLQTDVEQLVPVVLARAGYEKRLIESGGVVEEAFLLLVKTVEEGIAMVRQASPTGDPRFRLEKYLSSTYSGLADSPESAASVWEAAAKHYKTSYLAWTSYTDILIKQDKYVEARAIFRDQSSKNVDWPEAIWDAWMSFEHLHGSVEDLEDCLDRVERANIQVAARRAKEAEKAAQQAMQMALDHTPAMEAAAALVAEVAQAQSAPAEEVAPAMDVDQPEKAVTNKRKAEDEPEEIHKKAKPEPKGAPLKRDRENSTVFVAELPSQTTEDDLKALFKDCGEIREVKLTDLPNALVATVEFMERDSVPAALTKDKKRVRDQEIAVHMAWQSTLYVTNFPEKTDDAAMRDMFGKHGLIFDIRWPSKKFKSTRRFCYVQYTSPGSAKAALELHDQELEPGHKMSVLVSNPERKKERTDARADDKEIYVAGLSKFVTQGDLEKLFKTYGAIKGVRLTTDDAGHSKGFGFVEFEEEKAALAALSANNHELKNRRIAVTLADTRVRGRKGPQPDTGLGRKADARNRSIRLRNLPPSTQEGLLQQALEKIATVKRVEVFEAKNEAVVELDTPAEAGRLLLLPDPIVFEGNTLGISEEVDTRSAPRPAAPVGRGLFTPRTAGGRPKAGLGRPRAPPSGMPTGSAPAATSSSTPSVGKGQDDFRKLLS